MKFSIVIPVYNAEKTIGRTLLSVIHQSISRDDYEIVIVDDYSIDNTVGIIKFYQDIFPHHNWKVIEHGENCNKAITRNDGMMAATGEWICWLDSDDMYLPFYLEAMNQAIEKYPKSDVFYFGGIVTWMRWDMAVKKPNPVDVRTVFRSGGIMSGGFIFKKSCINRVGYLPSQRSPYAFGEEMLTRFPEVKPLYKPGQLDLGNPWGDDWAMWYLLTREYQPQLLNISPYVVIQRGEHQL